MPTSLMDCPECERLREEEDKAILLFKGANTELQAALESLDSNATLDLGQWKRLDAVADNAYQQLQDARQRTSEHRASHG